MDYILAGSYSVVVPYKFHKNFTGEFDTEKICKVGVDINYELTVARVLDRVDKVRANQYFTYMDLDSLRKLGNNSRFVKFLLTLPEFNKINKPISDFYYFTMDYSGKDLFELCHERSDFIFKDKGVFKNMIRQLLEGLTFLHKQNICHFDIKPENIVYCKYYNRFKYIDFGYSESYPFPYYIHFGPRGTPDYIPLSGNPCYLDRHKGEPKSPYIKCNDWTPKNVCDYSSDYYFYDKNRPELAFKTDSYALGKTIYYAYFFLIEIKDRVDSKFKYRTEALILKLIDSNINTREYVQDINLKEIYKLNKEALSKIPEFGSNEYLYNKESKDYGTNLKEISSDSSIASSCSVETSASSTLKKFKISKETSHKYRKLSESSSISSLEVQERSQNCLSNMLNKFKLKKLNFF